ncbi:crotonase/enoyl-CoA hydratase family protein [Aquimarina sp. I32.4]|uniref:crotonase/enoyl-CoA hydratase family protein n=1 Tax=Aquimarina sp. I32.4 TaxID=2053903 RepID=UPI000CDEC1C0|nr:crotonase/enoyl-CoA hydratase family protein [Aquimarina sp. I32.4]
MKNFDCITIEYFREQELLFWKINDKGRIPDFCLKRLEEFKEFTSWVKDYFSHPDRPVKFIVSTLGDNDLYSMRNDLSFVTNSIISKDKSALTLYGYLSVEAMYQIYNSFGLKALTVAFVEEDIFGGAFECALAHDFIVAEEQVEFSLPENKLFNMFPGMGAYSLLYRKLNTRDADVILTDRRVYKGRDLYDFGCINKIVEKSSSVKMLFSYIEKIKERFNFEYYHTQCKKSVFSLTKKELLNVTDLWVEAYMDIHPSDLYRMEVMENEQSRKVKVEI